MIIFQNYFVMICLNIKVGGRVFMTLKQSLFLQVDWPPIPKKHGSLESYLLEMFFLFSCMSK